MDDYLGPDEVWELGEENTVGGRGRTVELFGTQVCSGDDLCEDVQPIKGSTGRLFAEAFGNFSPLKSFRFDPRIISGAPSLASPLPSGHWYLVHASAGLRRLSGPALSSPPPRGGSIDRQDSALTLTHPSPPLLVSLCLLLNPLTSSPTPLLHARYSSALSIQWLRCQTGDYACLLV